MLYCIVDESNCNSSFTLSFLPPLFLLFYRALATRPFLIRWAERDSPERVHQSALIPAQCADLRTTSSYLSLRSLVFVFVGNCVIRWSDAPNAVDRNSRGKKKLTLYTLLFYFYCSLHPICTAIFSLFFPIKGNGEVCTVRRVGNAVKRYLPILSVLFRCYCCCCFFFNVTLRRSASRHFPPLQLYINL